MPQFDPNQPQSLALNQLLVGAGLRNAGAGLPGAGGIPAPPADFATDPRNSFGNPNSDGAIRQAMYMKGLGNQNQPQSTVNGSGGNHPFSLARLISAMRGQQVANQGQ